MPDGLSRLIGPARDAVDSCRGLVDQGQLDQWESVLSLVESRDALGFDLTVVGIMGGTGSGKSSLLNALSESGLADVGGIRPTTSTPIAVTRTENLAGTELYLRDRPVEILASNHLHPWIVLLDLPDVDSLKMSNRDTVEAFVPLLDYGIVVTDPEKYRDRILHEGLLASLAETGLGSLVALNQIDRVDPKGREDIEVDLRVALAEDESQEVALLVAVDPPAGPPLGLGVLWAELEQVNASHAAVSRWRAVLSRLAESVSEALGTGPVVPASTRALVYAAANQLLGDGSTAVLRNLRSELDRMSLGLPPGCLGVIREASESLPATIQRIGEETSPSKRTGRLASLFRAASDRTGPEDRRRVVEDTLVAELLDPLESSLEALTRARSSAGRLSADIAG